MQTIYPIMRYSDVRAAAQWLAAAFGFDLRQLDDGPDGTVTHAEVSLGGDTVMLSRGKPTRELPAADDWRVYVAVDDVDAHHDRAKAAGAEIVLQLVDQPYGSREYGARDLEGNVWCFGTYRP
jgi:uncharacterized glyoxalase superfamily protein PhnB